jgi:hypothetical protein
MLNLDLQNIAQVTNGRLTPASARVLVTGISTDSRSVRPASFSCRCAAKSTMATISWPRPCNEALPPA